MTEISKINTGRLLKSKNSTPPPGIKKGKTPKEETKKNREKVSLCAKAEKELQKSGKTAEWTVLAYYWPLEKMMVRRQLQNLELIKEKSGEPRINFAVQREVPVFRNGIHGLRYEYDKTGNELRTDRQMCGIFKIIHGLGLHHHAGFQVEQHIIRVDPGFFFGIGQGFA